VGVDDIFNLGSEEAKTQLKKMMKKVRRKTPEQENLKRT
jgi:hypothetical protein